MEIKRHNLFETPLYHLKEPKFLNLNKVCDKYIKEGKEYSKSRIKTREKHYKKKIGDFGLSHSSTTLLEEPKIKDFGKFIGQTSYNILESQGYDLSKHRVDFSELWVQEFGKNGGYFLTLTCLMSLLLIQVLNHLDLFILI